MPITVQNLVHSISRLNKRQDYNYIYRGTSTRIRVVDVQLPNGPITVRRYDPSKGQTPETQKDVTLSTNMLKRFAAGVTERTPINIDRLLGASYNTRSTLEALVAHTPNFWVCYPGRIEGGVNGQVDIKRGHKHLILLDDAHQLGEIHETDVDMVISESLIPQDVVYEKLDLPMGVGDQGLDIEVARRHAQIQIALLKIGNQIGLDTWIAQNDHGIVYEGQRLIEQPGAIKKLADVRLLSAFPDAAHAGRLIDVIWFRDGMSMPAVIEVEHSTGITSGLTRMKGFKDKLPNFGDVRWVIAAEEDLRDLAIREANKEQFRDLDVRFMPYNAIEELFSLCNRRKISGISDNFLDSFMEQLVD